MFTPIKNLNKLLLNEALKIINNNPKLLAKGQPFEFTRNSALHKIFYYSFIPSARFLLPEGIPPFNPSNLKAGTNSTDLLIAIRRGRLGYMVDKNIPSARREQLFIGLLETVNAEEAKVLIAVKDQTLDQMYPNLTYRVLWQYGYLPYDEHRCQLPTKSEPAIAEEPVIEKETQQPKEIVEQAEQPVKPKRKATTRRTTTTKRKTTATSRKKKTTAE